MVQSKPLRPEWLPAVALSSALALLMLVWSPPVGDLAAQVFRTELFEQAGLAIWNGSWYGGHYTLTYSVLFPPLAALLGPQVVGVLAVVSSSYLFDRLVRDRWGAEARWATLWFAAGVVTLLADGQLTFALGVAFGLASLRGLQTGRGALAVAAAAACALASPVAAAFLAGVVLAGALEPGRRASRVALAVAGLALVLTVVPNIAFPEPGQFPFEFSSYVAIPLFCGGALFVTRGLPEERQLRRVLVGYMLAATVIWLAPNAMGGNAVRLGALFGGPVLAAVVLARRPAGGDLVRRPGDGRRPLLAADRERQPDRPQRRRPLDCGRVLRAGGRLAARARGGGDADRGAADRQPLGVRLPGAEASSSPAAGCASSTPPATTSSTAPTGSPTAPTAPGCAATRSPTSPSPTPRSTTPRRRSAASSSPLRPTWTCAFSTPHWRIYEVRDPRPLVAPIGAAAARTLRVGRQGFALDVSRPGEFLVRVNFTPYWSIARGAGCILRRGDWTVARASHPGVFRVAADFSLGRAWNAVTGARKTC